MSGSIPYFLPPAPSPDTEPVQEPATASPTLPCPQEVTTEQGFLAMFDRLFPGNYLGPMKEQVGDGYELFEGAAAVGERVSLAIARMFCQSYIGSANGGSFATAQVQFFRPSPIPDGVTTVTVKAGSVVKCSGSDRLFVLLSDVAFAPDDLGPFQATVQAVEQSYEYNVRGPRTAADGTLIPGEIDTCYLLRQEPPYGDPTIQVSQVADASNGAPPALDQLGIDRALPRHAAEDDSDYRARIKRLPDTVSPAAIRRAAASVFLPWGHNFIFIETWQVVQCFNAGDAGVFGYNIPDGDVPLYANRWQSTATARGCFIIVCELLGCIDQPGFAFNDTGALDGSFPLTSPDTGGVRAVPAYNVDPSQYAPAWNGEDQQRNAVYAGLWDVIQAIKPAGVLAIFELEGQ